MPFWGVSFLSTYHFFCIFSHSSFLANVFTETIPRDIFRLHFSKFWYPHCFFTNTVFVKSNILNRYMRKRSKVNASIFDSALSHIRRSNESEKKEENSVSTFGRFRPWTSFESSPVSFKVQRKLTLMRSRDPFAVKLMQIVESLDRSHIQF